MSSTSYDTCRVCGAVVESMSKHRRWHDELKEVADSSEYAESVAGDLEVRVEALEARE